MTEKPAPKPTQSAPAAKSSQNAPAPKPTQSTPALSGKRAKIVLTLMVRDEVDIIAAMIEHHLAQGVDHIIATDNASTDGTREQLAQYEELGVLTLIDDPRHEKQQAEVVTKMARRAVDEFGADWVINADADEFWVPVDRSKTLAEVLPQLPASIESLRIPVTNVLGVPTEDGPVLGSLAWLDVRDEDALARVGLHAQPTPDMLVRGRKDLEIAQGNHFSNLPVTEKAPEGLGIEVLHVPFRSWKRYELRVRNTGEGYLANPKLTPSPRHHGMRDYRWLEQGALKPFYVARFPASGTADPDGFRAETWLPEHLRKLVASARRPELLKPLLADVKPLADAERLLREHEVLAQPLTALEALRADEVTALRTAHDQAISQRDEHNMQLLLQRETTEALTEQLAASNAAVAAHTERITELEAERDLLRVQLQAAQDRAESAQHNLDELQKYTANVVASRLVRGAMGVSDLVQGPKQALRPVAKKLLRR